MMQYSCFRRWHVTLVWILILEAFRPILALSRHSSKKRQPQPVQHQHFTLHVDDSSVLSSPPGMERYYPPMVSTPCEPLLSEIIQPPNVEDLYEWYCYTARTPDADPSWAVVWPTAATLVNHLLAHPQLVQNKRVVELGCGLGLAGLYAAALGATRVTLTDREPFSLHCAMSTAAVNHKLQERIQAVVLDWNTVPSSEEDELLQSDVVLASDVLYDPTSIQALARVCQTMANASSNGALLLLLTDPQQERYPGARAMLQEALHCETLEITSMESAMDGAQRFSTPDGKDHARRMREETVLIQCSILAK